MLKRLAKLDDDSRQLLVIGLVVLVSLLVFSGRLFAQQNIHTGTRGAIRPIVGAYVPTGEQRDFLKDAVLIGAQGSLNFGTNFAVTGSFGWSPSKDRLTAGEQTIDAYQYDLGLEVRTPQSYLGAITPFVGAGIGERTYNYRDLRVDAKTNVDGYGALGVDVGAGRV